MKHYETIVWVVISLCLMYYAIILLTDHIIAGNI